MMQNIAATSGMYRDNKAGFWQWLKTGFLLSAISYCSVIAANPQRIFMQPVAGLSAEQKLEFHSGESFVHKPWVIAPSTTTARDGLGPRYNAAACADCHIRNGKGRVNNARHEPHNAVLRLGNSAAGFQLQPRAIAGVKPEGRVQIAYQYHTITFADGERITLKKPQLNLQTDEPRYYTTQLSLRMPPLLAGMAVLESIPLTFIEQQLLQQQRSDAIRGRISKVRGGIGRFGWKAELASLEDQVALALHQDMGLTSAHHPQQNCNAQDDACENAVHGGEPEVSELIFQRMVQYVRWLAIPAPRINNTDVQAGQQLFEQLQCSVCHVPQVTGTALRPYTDLLLHDMGDALADTLDLPNATRRQWRTAPLHGIGVVNQLMPVKAYLHDGRAGSLLEAVLWHGGEAQASRDAVLLLNAAQRQQLILFLQSL